MRRLIFPVLLGLVGCAILIALGNWQVQRLQWKTGILEEIEGRIGAEPVPLPAAVEEEPDRFLPVTVSGEIAGEGLRVLVTPEGLGPGYRRILPFDTGERRVLLDAGWVPLEGGALPEGEIEVTGNVHWPEEVDRWTPDPDGDLWFARDVGPMAEALNTDPVMVIARDLSTPAGLTPLPVGTEGIPNDHLEYAITWFSLALVWAIMSVYLVVRTARRKDAQ
ncbi:SURF1 family protein [Histidinibacterium aquaticum]|uniref:SURF1-like protein n=1 Tax=Histidinibacterium aquaticum TaxID=2613962 RepID=A0A5J5GKJ1_9RHOB|nr:SURF1 family protein [Histidinibacterium aquaticum]KAA9008064.1 SURF1 family protein [Histidinibacterium aquaticum]